MGRLPRSASDKTLPSLPPSPSPILRREEQRLTLIAGLEDWLHELHGVDKLGGMGEVLDVHSCALRVVCEVAMVSNAKRANSHYLRAL